MEQFGPIHFSPVIASLDGLIVFVFVLIAIGARIASVFKKDKEDDAKWRTDDVLDQRKTSRPTPLSHVPGPMPSKRTDWEEELRRLLGEASPPPRPPQRAPVPPPSRPAPPKQPPVFTPPKPVAPPTPPVMSLPQVFEQEKYYKGHCVNCGGHVEFPSSAMGDAAPCPHCNQLTVLQPFTQTRVETLSHQKELASLAQSAANYRRASRLDETASAQIDGVRKKRVGTTTVQSNRVRSAEIDAVVGLLRKPQTARQAIIASVILSPPKSMES